VFVPGLLQQVSQLIGRRTYDIYHLYQYIFQQLELIFANGKNNIIINAPVIVGYPVAKA